MPTSSLPRHFLLLSVLLLYPGPASGTSPRMAKPVTVGATPGRSRQFSSALLRASSASFSSSSRTGTAPHASSSDDLGERLLRNAAGGVREIAGNFSERMAQPGTRTPPVRFSGSAPKTPPTPEESRMDWRWMWSSTMQSGASSSSSPSSPVAVGRSTAAALPTSSVVPHSSRRDPTDTSPSIIVFTPPPTAASTLSSTDRAAPAAKTPVLVDTYRIPETAATATSPATIRPAAPPVPTFEEYKASVIGPLLSLPTGRKAAVEGKPEYTILGLRHSSARGLSNKLGAPTLIAAGFAAQYAGFISQSYFLIGVAVVTVFTRAIESLLKSYHKAHRVLAPLIFAGLWFFRPQITAAFSGPDIYSIVSIWLAKALTLVAAVDALRQWTFVIPGV